MKIVIFGLTVSSSWGNGHATLWRALCQALARRGHEVVFFERDVPYYAAHRDLSTLPNGVLRLYSNWEEVAPLAEREIRDADAAIVTSYCPDSRAASSLIRDSASLSVFYDLDTPVTLAQLGAGASVPYIPLEGLDGFDLVLSFTGGRALTELGERLGARTVRPLYGSVDPAIHHRVSDAIMPRSDLSYLGTYAEDRQASLERLFVEPARSRPHERFLIGGAQYPQDFPWTDNIYFVRHVEPSLHPAFFCSSRLTLNVTRAAMREMGYCPSGRLFEAAACGTPMISDAWAGLAEFFAPGQEIYVARHAEDVAHVMALSDRELQQVGEAARDHVLACHTADHRAAELELYLEDAFSRRAEPASPSSTIKAGTL